VGLAQPEEPGRLVGGVSFTQAAIASIALETGAG
jgi:hypothetical protein